MYTVYNFYPLLLLNNYVYKYYGYERFTPLLKLNISLFL